MEKGVITFPMETITGEIIKMESLMDLVFILGQMVVNMKATF